MNAKDSDRCAQVAHQAVSCVHPAAHQSLHCRVYEMDAKESGRGAQAQFRLDGRVVTQAEYEAAQDAKFNAKKRRPKYVEEEVAWKGGLAQMRAAAAAQAAEAAEVRFCATFYNILRAHAFTDLLTAGTWAATRRLSARRWCVAVAVQAVKAHTVRSFAATFLGGDRIFD